MPRYVALLRGINLGGRNKVAMADLRQVAVSLGHTEVATYIQSGNLVFTSPDTNGVSLAEALEREIARRLAVQPAVVVLSRAELARMIADNPFPEERNPKSLHAVFRREDVGPDAIAAIAAAQHRAREKTAGIRLLWSAAPCSFTHPTGSAAASWPRNWRAPAAARQLAPPQLGDRNTADGHAQLDRLTPLPGTGVDWHPSGNPGAGSRRPCAGAV